jgi:ABC-type sugar transport system ATPase subunit
VGRSGSGKTTLPKLLLRLSDVQEGRVLVDGQDISRCTQQSLRRQIAYVPQEALLFHRSIRENIAYGKPEATEEEIREAARQANALEFIDRLPRGLDTMVGERGVKLSGGQRQRVAVGRAIVREPAVFLFDEPLSNLDAKMRVEMRAEIVRLHHALGATMIYVTHDQTEAMTMGDRIVVMEGGRIQQAAPPLEVYDRPANKFVASFIGTPPMNLLPPGVLDLGRTVGVRPEHLRIFPAEGAPEGALRAHVDIVEPLGAETLVHAVLDGRGTPIVARAPGAAAIRHGDAIALVPDMEKAVKFD